MKKNLMKIHGRRFSWQKKKLVLSLFLIAAVFFLIYQLIFVYILGHSDNKTEIRNDELKEISENPVQSFPLDKSKFGDIFNEKGLIRGTRLIDIQKYKTGDDGKFKCFSSNLKINFSSVNDDYCDCVDDGSDEPGTNACNNGHFYCTYQPRHTNEYLVIPSSKVNDGICDCCDGSDEWNNGPPLNLLSLEMQKKLGYFHAPCINFCNMRL